MTEFDSPIMQRVSQLTTEDRSRKTNIGQILRDSCSTAKETRSKARHVKTMPNREALDTSSVLYEGKHRTGEFFLK